MKKNHKVSFGEGPQGLTKVKINDSIFYTTATATSEKISQIETLLSKTPNNGGLFETLFPSLGKEIKEKIVQILKT